MTAQEEKLAALIGFATKAGRVLFGCEQCVSGVRKQKKNGVQLLLCSADASANTKKRVYDCAAFYRVAVQTLPFSSEALAQMTGKAHPIAVIAITDSGFAAAIEGRCEPSDMTTNP